MTDYTELKRLAEAFPVDLDWDGNTEPFFNGPSGESLGGGATGFYCVYGKPFRLEGDDYDYDGPTYVEACPADFAKFMVAAREGVLALIAENERLKTSRSATERDLAQELEVWRRGPSCWNCGDTGDVHDMVGEWRGQCDCNAAKLIDVASERDQLKAENEALRKDLESHKRMLLAAACDLGAIGEALGAEMDDDGSELEGIATQLRKDAERLQSATAFVQKLCDSAGKQPSVATGYLHDILSALGKGEQS